MKTRVTLDEELAKLSPEIEPPRDLWPGVVRGIVRTPRSAPRLSSVPWMAYAASAAGICLAAALTWVMVDGYWPTTSSPGLANGSTPAATPPAQTLPNGSPRGSPVSRSASAWGLERKVCSSPIAASITVIFTTTRSTGCAR